MKKTLSLFLALCMVFTMSPVSAMAEEVYRTPDTEIIAFEPLADTEQSVAIGTAIEDLALPKTLTATVKKAVNAKEEAEQNSGIPEEYMASGSVPDAAWVEISQEISVTWACQTGYDKDTAGEYLFAPVIISYELKDGVELPQIKVTVVAVALRSVKTTVVSSLSALKTAFSNATDGEIIQLGADIEFGDTDDRLELMLGQKSVTLDLNGHTLDGKSKSAIYLYSGTLTITDNTSEGKGIIRSTAFGTIQAFSVSHLIIEGGTVSSTSDVIICQNNSKLSVKGGKVEAGSYGAAINGGSGTISVSGGEVIAGTSAAIEASKILISADAKITSAAMFGTIEFARDDETSSFTMTGGLVENTGAGAALDFETAGSFSITGGTIQNTGTGSAIKVSYNPQIHFIGGDAKIINSDATNSTINLQINSYYGTPGLTISGATIQNLSTGYAVQCSDITIPVFIIGDKTTVIKSNQTAMNTVPDPDEGFKVVDSEGAELVLTSAKMKDYKHLEFRFLGSPTDVASIGEDSYDSLQEAVDAVGDGQTITLLKDTFKGFTISEGNTASFTLDLNGHALQSQYDVAIIHNGSGKLTVNDTSGGKITARSKYNPAIEAIALNGGSLEVMKGTIEGRQHVIYNRGSGIVTISGGAIRCSAGGSYAIYNASDGIVSIKDGKVSGDCVIYSKPDGMVYVSGGELINKASTANRDTYPTIKTDGDLYISGGEINGNRNLAIQSNADVSKKVEISGGTLTCAYDYTVWINVGCILSISGGTIKNTSTKSYSATIYSYNASYSEPAKVEIKEGSPILITGPVMAMNIAPDMSTYTNVKIMASTTATDGTATSQITKEHIDTNEKTRAYKYLEFTAGATAPTITSVSKTSADGTYTKGESLSFTVDFDKIVNVTGTPHLVLSIGSQTRQAVYQSGSGTTSLTFSYTVQSGDMDDDGIECVSPITLNGGTITGASGNNAVLTFTPPDTTGILVDTTPPSITTQPLDQTVNEGQSATFAVTASSTSLLLYQWQIDPTGTGASFMILPGTSGSSYTIPATTPAMNGFLYRCMLTNAAGNIYSDAATLTVSKLVSATPTATTTTVAKTSGDQASVSFTLTNNPAYADGAMWKVYAQSTGVELASGVTAANIGNALTLTHATDLPAATYYVAVTESGKAESARLALTVGASASLTGTVTISPYPRIGNHLNVQVSSNNSGTLSYVWKADGVQVGTDMIYTVAAADYGKIITLEITSSVQSGTLTSNSTAAVAKKIAPAAPSAPVLSSKTHNSVTLMPNPAYEYSKDGTIWQKSNVFGDLTASMEYTFYQRVAETSDTEKSAASRSFSVTTDAASSYIYTVTFMNGSSVHATKTVAYPAMIIDTLPNNPTNGRYTFSGWYTGTNGSGTRFSATTPVVSNLTVYAYWTGGSSDEDGSSLDDNDSVIVAPAPSDRPNPPTQGEVKVSGTVDAQGNATIHLSDRAVSDAVDKALAEARRNGNEQNGIALVLRVDTGSNNAAHVRVNLPKTVQDIIIAKKIVNTILVVDNPDITIALDLASVKTINSQANSDVQLTATRMESNTLTDAGKIVIGSRPVFDLGVNYGNCKQVQSFGTGSVSVTIPYTLGANEHAGNVQAVYVDTNGKAHWLVNSVYDSVNQVLRFSTSHFSTYGVGYRHGAPVLTDIRSHWAKDAMQFVANRGLITGTTGTTFSPNTAMTRGALVTALGRLAKVDVSGYKQSSFTDVKTDAYYMAYIEWANRNNILNGIGNGKFASDQSITREQMAVIIQNYAKVVGYTLPKVHAENHFADSAKISASTKDAVKQMQMAGIVGSKNGNLFDPQGIATRAEVSVVLHRFVELMLSSDAMEGWWMNDSGQWMYYENGKPSTGSINIDGLTYIFDQYGVTVDLPRRSKDGTYTVQKGDSFWLIAHKLGCTMSDLERLNNKSRFDLIIPGDVLRVSEK